MAAAPALADACKPSQPLPAPSAAVFDCSTHLMHGVLHYNGFGHLARINGARPLPAQRPQDRELSMSGFRADKLRAAFVAPYVAAPYVATPWV